MVFPTFGNFELEKRGKKTEKEYSAKKEKMDEFAVSWHATYYKLKYILSNSKSLHLLKQKDHMISTKCPREMEDLNFSMFGSIIAVFVLIFFHLKPNLEKKLYLFKQLFS